MAAVLPLRAGLRVLEAPCPHALLRAVPSAEKSLDKHLSLWRVLSLPGPQQLIPPFTPLAFLVDTPTHLGSHVFLSF